MEQLLGSALRPRVHEIMQEWLAAIKQLLQLRQHERQSHLQQVIAGAVGRGVDEGKGALAALTLGSIRKLQMLLCSRALCASANACGVHAPRRGARCRQRCTATASCQKRRLAVLPDWSRCARKKRSKFATRYDSDRLRRRSSGNTHQPSDDGKVSANLYCRSIHSSH